MLKKPETASGPSSKKRLGFAPICVITFWALQAAAGPGIFVEKSVNAQQTKFILSGSSLPELRSITFACTYAVSNAAIMDAIVSSPQPATVVSVLVDTATASLSVSIHAVSTLQLPNNGSILVFKINSQFVGATGPITFTKASIIDKQGAASEFPVVIKTSISGDVMFGPASPAGRVQIGRMTLCEINGRKISNSAQHTGSGFYCKSVGCVYTAKVFCIR
jgi:hypothetical protein